MSICSSASTCSSRRFPFGLFMKILVVVNIILLTVVMYKRSQLPDSPQEFTKLLEKKQETLPVAEVKKKKVELKPTAPPVVVEVRVKNPPAIISTSIKGNAAGHEIDKIYAADGFYWGINVKQGDHFEMVFREPIKLYRVEILSGAPGYEEDKLLDSVLEISTDPYDGKCRNYRQVKEFIDASTVDHTFVDDDKFKLPMVQCIRLKIKKVRVDSMNRPRWLIIRDIYIN